MTAQEAPAPAEWLQRLAEKLRKRDADYIAFIELSRNPKKHLDHANPHVRQTDPRANATQQFGAAVADILEALGELPPFAAGDGLVTLHDLLAALATLDNGGRAEMLQPRPNVAGKKRHTSRDYVEANVVFCVELLASIGGMNRSKARAEVAKKFSDAGYTGRQRETANCPLSPKTIYDWEVAIESEGSSPRSKFLAMLWADHRANQDGPLSEERAKEIIAQIARYPLLKTKGAAKI